MSIANETAAVSPVTSQPFVNRLRLANFLSFGPESAAIELSNLNVLIGPNGSGKSNVLEAISLLKAAPANLRDVVRRGGGVGEWIWKGAKDRPCELDVVVESPGKGGGLRHVLAFAPSNQSFAIVDERIENAESLPGKPGPLFYYRFQSGNPVLSRPGDSKRVIDRESVEPDASILAQMREPELYPELAHLADNYSKFRVYREWAFGRSAIFRTPQPADMRSRPLEEDFSNLGLFLNYLRGIPKAKAAILKGLKELYSDIDDFDVRIEGGTVQVFFTEGDYVIPATRLSDGTLRFLCLLAILCDPNPPPLICIEEPELGLHPDILPKLAELLIESAKATQLIVTTHSDALVDALTDIPESVVVCERHEHRSVLKRLSGSDLEHWLAEYKSLGALWMKGHLGGTRW